MNRWMNFRSAFLAGLMFALGFFVADRMTNAGASPLPVAQEGSGAAFGGADGAVVVKSHLLVIRGHKVYRIDPSGTGGNLRPWGDLAE